jgi:hypothetical protein
MSASLEHLVLVLARAVHEHAGMEHKEAIAAAVADWPHAQAFLAEKKAEPAMQESTRRAPPPEAADTTERRGPPVTRRSQSAPDV